jgi:hypothetical protein
MRRASDTYVGGESDGRVLPTKCSNNDGVPSAEGMEGRRPTKENAEQTTAPRTQSRTRASSGLLGVREVARKGKRVQFTALPPRDGGAVLGQLLRAQTRRGTWSGRRNVEGLRDGPRGAAAGFTQPRSHLDGQRCPEAAVDRQPWGYRLSAPWRTRSFRRRGHDPESDLRAGVRGVLVWVPSRA